MTQVIQIKTQTNRLLKKTSVIYSIDFNALKITHMWNIPKWEKQNNNASLQMRCMSEISQRDGE